MSNQNDNSAFIYDEIYAYYLDPQLTEAETILIESLVKSSASILDVGCGTGRHAVVLAQAGYNVTGIDDAGKMLEELNKKSTSVTIINDKFLEHDFRDQKFDLIILMFNVFNEFIFDEETAADCFDKFGLLLKNSGKVLINISDPGTFNQKDAQFSNVYEKKGLTYQLQWKIISFDKKTNTTVSREQIIISDSQGKKVKEIDSDIKQRWWREDELKRLAKKTGFQVKLNRLKLNNDYYFIFSKND
jgi:SAM-dependent methyltransferase